MKTNIAIMAAVLALVCMCGTAAAWLPDYACRQQITLTGNASGAQTNFQVLLNVSYDAHMQANFSDLRFTTASDVLIDAWLESNTTDYALVWTEFPTTPADGVDQTYYMYYGNAGASSDWSGTDTFLQYHGATSSQYMMAATVNPTNVVYEGIIRPMSDPHYYFFGLSNYMYFWGDALAIISYTPPNKRQFVTQKDKATTWRTADTHFQLHQWYRLKITNDGTEAHGYVDGVEISYSSTTDIPTANIGLWIRTADGTIEQEWAFARKYAASPPTHTLGVEEYESYTPPDPINLANTTGNFWINHAWQGGAGNVSDSYNVSVNSVWHNTTPAYYEDTYLPNAWQNITVWAYNSTRAGVLSAGSISQNTQMRGDMIVIEGASVSPDPLYTNNTQDVVISFVVAHIDPLNRSSMAFLSAINYTGDANGYNYYHQLRYPATDIADADPTAVLGNVFRNLRRNITPYLTFEDNASMTEGNNYKWGGHDNNSYGVSFNNVNSTHTFVNVTMHPLETSTTFKYISEQRILDAAKTPISIDKSQSVVMKVANPEEILLRDDHYSISLYFDSVATAALPSADILVYCGNESFNPLTDDFTTSEYATIVGTINYTSWRTGAAMIDGKYSMFGKLLFPTDSLTFDPTPIMYVALSSNTQSSKPYILNTTNDVITGVNRSFAQTDSLWAVNELSHVSSPVAYTANMMAKFVRLDEQIEYKMYIADTGGNWSTSGIHVHTIDDSNLPPTLPSFMYFNTTCDDRWVDDPDMDGTYDNGVMWVGINPGIDPDGGVIAHNLTLHESDGDYVTTINNTFNGDSLIEIEFTTTPCYSTTTAYTLRCVATDDVGASVTTWLGNNFTLAADGTTGNVVTDDLVWFWGYNDIPALHTAIGNPSIMSLSGGIYTMHRPFYKSKCNDTFTFDEDVHLRSNGGDDVAHFRAVGTIYFEDSNVRAWNTNTNAVATEHGSDEHRSYLLFGVYLDGHIKNCDMSYLGTDVYRQEGINFVNVGDFRIENSRFEHNSRGILMENCDNITMTGCTCSNNHEVGTGIYFTGNSTVEGGVYNDNGYTGTHSGIRTYHGLYNVIEGTTITNSALHGLWMQYSDHNIVDTCGITGSEGGHDYYFSSASTNNTIIDATRSFNIRTTSTSDVNITTTDNRMYTETSQYTPTITHVGAYMLHHGVSATFSVGVVDMYITPHGGSLTMPAFVFDETTTFTLDTSDPITHVEIEGARSEWVYEGMWLDVGGEFYDTYTAGVAGNVVYNYTGGFAVSPLSFSIHERILEGWQALGEDTKTTYTDFTMFIGIGVLIIVVGGVIIGLRSFAGEVSPEVIIMIAVAIGIGLLLLVTMVEVIPSVMEPMENITMEGI